jgi:uncharacterized protein
MSRSLFGIRGQLRRGAGAAFAGVLAGAGCGHSAPTQYLGLRTLLPEMAAPPSSGPPFRVLAVRFPAWLDRMEVTRPTTDDMVRVEEFARWAAPPGDLAQSVLAEDLSARLPGVAVQPAGAPTFTGARDILVELASVEQRGAALEVAGVATVTDANTGALILRLPLRVLTGAPSDAHGEARALDQLLAEIANQLAQVLRVAEPKR